jgi:hypothetical protein
VTPARLAARSDNVPAYAFLTVHGAAAPLPPEAAARAGVGRGVNTFAAPAGSSGSGGVGGGFLRPGTRARVGAGELEDSELLAWVETVGDRLTLAVESAVAARAREEGVRERNL